MFGIGTQEVLLILVLAVIIVGPRKLPELANTLGKSFGELRRAFDGLKESAVLDIKTDLEKENLLKEHPNLDEAEKRAREMQAPPIPELEHEPDDDPVPFPEDAAAAQKTAAAPAELDESEGKPSYKPEDMES